VITPAVVALPVSRGQYTDQMEFTDTQALSDDEMGRLVSIALEEFRRALNRTQFNDVMLRVFEQIPGLETLPRRRSQQYLKLLWLKYQQAILANQYSH
jgi:hypothetical protein